jgi:hypothetical protein
MSKDMFEHGVVLLGESHEEASDVWANTQWLLGARWNLVSKDVMHNVHLHRVGHTCGIVLFQ